MTRTETTIRNELGLHLRAASKFVSLASRFKAQVRVGTADVGEVDGKSILGLVTLGSTPGSTLSISADGPDEADAVRALVELVEQGFGELGAPRTEH